MTLNEQPANSPREEAAAPDLAYGAPFWLTFASNIALMVAICLLYRYADLITYLGGTELQLGWIVGVGMVGSLLMRVAQAAGIEQLGCRRVWLWSTAGYLLACIGHLFVTRCDSPLLYALRILYQTSISGFFGATITFVSLRAPPPRIAEVIGTLGTSGFMGMILGPALGDWLCGGEPVTRAELQRMFLCSAGLAVVSWACGWWATRGGERRAARRRQPILWLLRKYRPPAALLAVGAVAGAAMGMPAVFLRTYTEGLGIDEMSSFFSVYAGLGLAARIAVRRMPERLGLRPMVLVGMAAVVLSLLAYLPVRTAWQLAAPAVLLGVAHAVLFPAVMAEGSLSFPLRNRGLATTLMLAMLDIGSVIGAPLAGTILGLAEARGWPPYPTLFVTLAMIFAVVGVWYAATDHTPADLRHTRPLLDESNS